MLYIKVLLNNFFYRLGWARWRLEIITIVADGKEVRVASLIIRDAERLARLKYPGDDF